MNPYLRIIFSMKFIQVLQFLCSRKSMDISELITNIHIKSYWFRDQSQNPGTLDNSVFFLQTMHEGACQNIRNSFMKRSK